MSATGTPSFLEKASKFIVTHKSAVAITAIVGASTAAGAYYYLSNPASDQSISSSKKKKKSKKKAKKTKKTPEESDDGLTESLVKDAIYPVDKETMLPKVDDELVATLSLQEKEEYAAALKETGNAFYKKKEYQKAIEYYTAALRCKEDSVFYSNRSACYALLGNHEKVIEDTTKAIALKPDYIKCLLRRAQSYEALENYEDAMFDLSAVTIFGGFSNKSTEPQLDQVLQKQSVKLVEERLKNHTPTLPTSSSISPFFGAFKPDSILELADESSLKEDSGEKFLVEAIKKIALNTTEGYEEADVLIKQSTQRFGKELSPSSPEAEYAAVAFEYLGAFDFLKNNSEMAINNILYSIALKPRARAHVLLALIYADRQEIENAQKQFDDALALSPGDADVYYHQGQVLYLSNDLANAAKMFEKAKELNPNNLYSYIQLACILYREGNVSDADKKFAEAKSKFPTSPEIPNYYGEILSDKRDIDGAIKQFDIAARLQSKLPTFTIGAALLINKATLVSTKDLGELEEILLKAIELDPKSEIAKITLAQVKLQSDKPEDAIKLFEELSDLARGYSEKLQATQFAELAKMQVRLKADPVLSAQVQKLMAQAAANGAFAR